MNEGDSLFDGSCLARSMQLECLIEQKIFRGCFRFDNHRNENCGSEIVGGFTIDYVPYGCHGKERKWGNIVK